MCLKYALNFYENTFQRIQVSEYGIQTVLEFMNSGTYHTVIFYQYYIFKFI